MFYGICFEMFCNKKIIYLNENNLITIIYLKFLIIIIYILN